MLILAIGLFAGALQASAQTDSTGIYCVTSSSVNRMAKLKYKQMNIHGGLLLNAKITFAFDGSTSTNRFQDTATFRLFLDAEAENGSGKSTSTIPLSVEDFSIGRFEVEGGKRCLKTKATILLKELIGTKDNQDIDVEIKQIRDAIYELTVSAPPGEYCLIPGKHSTDARKGIFDFTIE